MSTSSTDTEAPADAETEAESTTEAQAESTAEANSTAESEESGRQSPASAPEVRTVTSRHGRFPLRLSLPVTIVLATVLVLALAAAGTLGVLLAGHLRTERAGAEALATAKAYAVTVTSYDYQNLDRNFGDVLDGATGEFKDQYGGASKVLRQLITDAKAKATGTVQDAGIQSATPDQVEVLVFVDQTITNAVTPRPRLDRNRVLMTLTRHDGRWLVEKLELV